MLKNFFSKIYTTIGTLLLDFDYGYADGDINYT